MRFRLEWPRLLLWATFLLIPATFLAFAAWNWRARVASEEIKSDDTSAASSGAGSTVMRHVIPDLRQLATTLGCTLHVVRSEPGDTGSKGNGGLIGFETRRAFLQFDDENADHMDVLVQKVENELAKRAGERGANLGPFDERLKGDHINGFTFDYRLDSGQHGQIAGRVLSTGSLVGLDVMVQEW